MQERIRRSLLSAREDGFTLVELIVAMLVMAIVMMAIIFIQARALTTNADSGSRQQATTYANAAMEQMRAIPWNILKKGMASNYLSAGSAVIGGSDLPGRANEVKVNGYPLTLVVAPSGSGDQDLGNPWEPLFDANGSNIAIKLDPSGRGDEYIVKSYVTEDQTGNSEARGLAVVVEWRQRTNGEVSSTVLFSTAFAPSGGCGNLNNAPFMASCQALFYAGSSSANVVMSVASSVPSESASPAPVPAPNAGDQLPLLPGSDFFTLQMSTSNVAARASGQQVSTTDSYVNYGGTVRDDSDTDTDPTAKNWEEGYGAFTLSASNDLVTVGAPPPNPPDLAVTANDTSMDVAAGVGVDMSIHARSDDRRQGTLDASVTQACSTGVSAAKVPASNPCASAELGGSNLKSGYLELELGSERLQLGRVLHGVGTTEETAWAGRFTPGVNGNTVTGCQVLVGAGCVSAGAERYIGDISIGAVVTGSTSWDGGDASQGLVVISDYHDSVGVQRGSQQTDTAPTISRSGTVSYWNGSHYLSVTAGETRDVTLTIAEATWTTPLATVTADGKVTIAPSSTETGYLDPQCKAETCSVDARNGFISVRVNYTVVPTDTTIAPFELVSTTRVEGSQASATYKEPEDNA